MLCWGKDVDAKLFPLENRGAASGRPPLGIFHFAWFLCAPTSFSQCKHDVLMEQLICTFVFRGCGNTIRMSQTIVFLYPFKCFYLKRLHPFAGWRRLRPDSPEVPVFSKSLFSFVLFHSLLDSPENVPVHTGPHCSGPKKTCLPMVMSLW